MAPTETMSLNRMFVAERLVLKEYPKIIAIVVNIIFVIRFCMVQGLCTLKAKMLSEVSDSLNLRNLHC